MGFPITGVVVHPTVATIHAFAYVPPFLIIHGIRSTWPKLRVAEHLLPEKIPFIVVGTLRKGG